MKKDLSVTIRFNDYEEHFALPKASIAVSRSREVESIDPATATEMADSLFRECLKAMIRSGGFFDEVHAEMVKECVENPESLR